VAAAALPGSVTGRGARRGDNAGNADGRGRRRGDGTGNANGFGTGDAGGGGWAVGDGKRGGGSDIGSGSRSSGAVGRGVGTERDGEGVPAVGRKLCGGELRASGAISGYDKSNRIIGQGEKYGI